MANGREALRRTLEKHKKQKEQQLELQQQLEKESQDQQAQQEQPKRIVIKAKPTSKEKVAEKVTPHRWESEKPKGKTEILPKNDRRPPKKQKSFEESHKRFTNYLKVDYYNIIQDLRKRGEIESMTSLLNDAVHEYLVSYFSEEL